MSSGESRNQVRWAQLDSVWAVMEVGRDPSAPPEKSDCVHRRCMRRILSGIQ